MTDPTTEILREVVRCVGRGHLTRALRSTPKEAYTMSKAESHQPQQASRRWHWGWSTGPAIVSGRGSLWGWDGLAWVMTGVAGLTWAWRGWSSGCTSSRVLAGCQCLVKGVRGELV